MGMKYIVQAFSNQKGWVDYFGMNILADAVIEAKRSHKELETRVIDGKTRTEINWMNIDGVQLELISEQDFKELFGNED